MLIALSLAGTHNDSAAMRAGHPAAGAANVNALVAGIPQHGQTLGRASAPLTLVEYADLQCPFCREAAVNVVPTLIDRFVRAGRLKIEFRPLAFLGSDSERLARIAAAAAAQNRLWGFAELAYRNQGPENSGYATTAFVRGVARSVTGLDATRALRDANGNAAMRLLAQAQAEAQAGGVTGTPTFRLVDRAGRATTLDSSSLTASAFTTQIDRALTRQGGTR
jgi:protein-disulfide isomerase